MNLKHHLYDFVNVRHMPHQPYPPELLSSEVPATLQLLHPLIISVTSPCTFFKTILSFLRCKHKSAHSIEGIGVLRFCIAAKLCFFSFAPSTWWCTVLWSKTGRIFILLVDLQPKAWTGLHVLITHSIIFSVYVFRDLEAQRLQCLSVVVSVCCHFTGSYAAHEFRRSFWTFMVMNWTVSWSFETKTLLFSCAFTMFVVI